MDFSDPRQREIFFTLHSGLPREGPGNGPSTARALALAGPLPQDAEVLDIACGPGAQTLDLARLMPHAHITAIDLHEPFLRDVESRAKKTGVASRIQTLKADMAALELASQSFDLIWCEGAAYIMGVATALLNWKRLLRPSGALALSEAVWLKVNPPAEVRALWAEYPAMSDAGNLRALARRCGYAIAGEFVLPEDAWWTGYYTPMLARIETLSVQFTGDALALAVLDEHRREIDMFRRYSDYYGYMFIVLKPET
jgi:ubiquinone/menaquinone biosynthesis C-methylase UbiE